MAWITKPSATTRIERRDEPYLTEEMRAKVRETFVPRYETRLACSLPALHLVQHEYGWIPAQALMEIAEVLELEPADVLDTASFYEEYWLERKGKHVVAVCRSIACEFCGQRQVTDAIKAHLGIEVGETTDDERFTLVELECIGACGGAPALLIDETLHEGVTPASVIELIDQIRD